MKTISTILFAWLCAATPLLAQPTTYFFQDFNSTTNYANYISPSPTVNQFTQLTTSNPSIISIDAGELVLTRTATGSGTQVRFGRSTAFSAAGPPTALHIRFKLTVSPMDAQANAANFYVGGVNSGGFSYQDDGSTPSGANTYAKIEINFTVGGFQLRDVTNNNTSPFTYTGTHNITWILNNSGSPVPYAVPNAQGKPSGAIATLADDKIQIYVDDVKQFSSDFSPETATQAMNYFKFLYGNGLGSIKLDDINILGDDRPLPVSLLNFMAQANENNTVDLKWVTAKEHNSSHFVVERSPNLDNFTEIARLDAAGNTTAQRNYHYTDLSPLIGTNYYRLRQIDLDGAEQLYRPVSVQISTDVLQVFPNPTSEGEIFLQSSNLQTLSVELLSATGEKMTIQHEICSENQQKLRLPLGTPPGLYMLAVHRTDNQTTYRKIAVR